MEIDHLDDVSAKKLYQALEECDNPQKKISVLIPILTGMRKGDMCGVYVQAVHFGTFSYTVKYENEYIAVFEIEFCN